ncbi:adhesion G-protein coupled receptor G4 isoform X2 [Takifugu flavidus]|uniref:adhesion G-protein coupled receptor G4 isoform X2 n=1 Tax=Takifugu flavidus TaxID=433684 RepID=UPI0025444373|nr:adhesion G-protein coupled receptor G4 isoform X2 [Takifugu flavidus]
MIFLLKGCVFITLSLLSSVASDSSLSLWGQAASFDSRCNHWKLKRQVGVPPLQEFTICFYLNLEVQGVVPWTVFMYRHPEVQYTELGFGGRDGLLLVWLFGKEWSTRPIVLDSSRWYMICLTWTHTTQKPNLYIDGIPEDIREARSVNVSSPPSTTSCKLAPNGTLTLGAKHQLLDGNIQIDPVSGMLGKLSLFRLWKRERSKQEVTSLECTEGDLVMWWTGNWDVGACPSNWDPRLRCEWSLYEVKLIFAIIPSKEETTDLSSATELLKQWLGDILPAGVYVHGETVSEVMRRAGAAGSLVQPVQLWWTPGLKRFDCLIYLIAKPDWDVADMQKRLQELLQRPYNPPDGRQQLLPDESSIRTTAVESFPAATSTSVGVTEASPVTSTSNILTSVPTAVTTGVTASTTFITNAANMSDVYFQVQMNVSMTGECDTEQTLFSWVNSSLPNDTMLLLSLQLIHPRQRNHPDLLPDLRTLHAVMHSEVSRVSCLFQVLVTTATDIRETEQQIKELLLEPFNNGSISIATDDIHIRRMFLVTCSPESMNTRKGLFNWPLTAAGKHAILPCPKDPHCYATRHCKLSITTYWVKPDLDQCPILVETIPDLDHIQVTPENAHEVVEMMESLLRNQSTLSYNDLLTVLNKLKDVVNISVVTTTLAQALIDIISDILESDSDLLPFTNMILNITEAIGGKMVGTDSFSNLTAPSIAISVVDIHPGQFSSLTFGVSSDRAGTKPKIFINQEPFNGTVAFISLPSGLQHNFPQNSSTPTPPRIMFQFFGIPLLFRGSEEGRVLNTFVVAASVTNATTHIQNLKEDVKITLYHLTPNTLQNSVECVYWNYNKNNGQGGWDDYGCRKHNSTSDYTTCLCNHLTHFGVLLDVSRTPVDWDNEQILTIITYLGCGVSSLFLGITILTYTAFEKLRRDYPSQILINLSLALLGLNLLFLLNSWLSSWGLHGLCVAAASLLHYFQLASFTWMGLEAIHMYFALVKVFNVYVPSYILKFCVLGWGVPLLICGLVFLINHNAYGRNFYFDQQSDLQLLDNSDTFCFIHNNVMFYVSVVAYAVLVFLFNIAIFVVVLIQIRHMKVNSPAGSRQGLIHNLKGVASLTLLLGLTWSVGFFTWGPARIFMLYLFSGLNSLQGFFIFIFHCLMKESVRKQWRINLCCGRFRLDEYSEWSNSASVGGLAKPRSNPPRASLPSVQSSSTDTTSTSSDSTQKDVAYKRPILGEKSQTWQNLLK